MVNADVKLDKNLVTIEGDSIIFYTSKGRISFTPYEFERDEGKKELGLSITAYWGDPKAQKAGARKKAGSLRTLIYANDSILLETKGRLVVMGTKAKPEYINLIDAIMDLQSRVAILEK